MPSLTPLHETYCKWDRTPPSQADVLEGLAQLVTTRLGDVVQDLIQEIQREILISLFGMSEQRSKKIQNIFHNNYSRYALRKNDGEQDFDSERRSHQCRRNL